MATKWGSNIMEEYTLSLFKAGDYSGASEKAQVLHFASLAFLLTMTVKSAESGKIEESSGMLAAVAQAAEKEKCEAVANLCRAVKVYIEKLKSEGTSNE